MTKPRALRKCAAPFACRLVIMAKLPVAGRVKTRLAREIGTTGATRFYRTAALNVMARLGHQPFWRTSIAISPDSGVVSPILPRHIQRWPQRGGSLGHRMHRPMRTLPPGPVCVIGTDVPSISVMDVRRAFRLLGQRDAVFGPAEDGGFWLVGFKRRPRLVWPYAGVGWSQSDTLAQVLANLNTDGQTFAMTTRLSDVDTAADLSIDGGRYARRVGHRT